jgi:hypothetical protein
MMHRVLVAALLGCANAVSVKQDSLIPRIDANVRISLATSETGPVSLATSETGGACQKLDNSVTPTG